jgi:hypothetical protein
MRPFTESNSRLAKMRILLQVVASFFEANSIRSHQRFNMSLARFVRRGLLAAGVALATSCGIVDPCEVGADVGMNGDWFLTRVNGQPILGSGFPLPFPSTDRLTAGVLRFKTLKQASCQEGEEKSSGRVVAAYSLVTATGQPKPAKAYGGSFEYDNRIGTVTLKAFDKSVDGDRFGEEFTVRPDIPLFGTYVLTFQRNIF